MGIVLYRVMVLILALSLPVLAQTSEQVMRTAVQSGPIQNKSFDSTNSFSGITITGTIPGGAIFNAITLPNPTLTGSIGGSATWPAPGAIGGSTPAAITGTTITASAKFVVGTPTLSSGAGSPEGVVTAPIGSTYLRTDGSTGTTLYVKESGVGMTGWTAVSDGGALNWTVPGTLGSGTPNTGAFTTLSVTGQFSSTLSTGTAPFVVASTTKVSNLNSDLLDGGDWAAPVAIGTTTPAAITGTTITANTKFIVGTPTLSSGAGSPEGVVTAPVASVYLRTDGGAGTVIYSKEAGSGNAGWVVVAPATIDWTVPGTIGSVTPNAASFTTATAFRYQHYLDTPTYGATVTPAPGNGSISIITATNNSNFAIANPNAPLTGQFLSIMVKNASGGVLGTITWDTLYKMASFSKPANGFRRTVTFLYDGTNWVEINCSPEVPN